MSPRTPESCRYRQVEETSNAAACELLHMLLGGHSEVSQEVCQACCRGFEPTVRDFNPVIASLVWSQTLERLADPDCPDRQRWEAISQQAEASLPPVLPDEDDLPVVRTVASHERLSVERIVEVLPPPAQQTGPVTRWSVGVTTAPRRSPTLATCLRSLAAAGWDRPHLFVDGEVEIPVEFDALTRTVRAHALGARQSYYLALKELLERDLDADALLLVQDDSLWPGHLPVREYLEAALWPGPKRGLVSCWCCSDDTATSAGWHAIPRPWRFGAVAFIFPREYAERFVQDEEIQQLCRCEPGVPTAGLSLLIGDWAWKQGIPIYFTTPSLVQHIGEVSAIFENSRAVGVRWASRYLGDEVQG